MQANLHELPLRGNWFAENEYLSQDLSAGALYNRAGARVYCLNDDFVVGLANALAASLGPKTEAVLTAIGRDWGRRAAGQFAAEMERHHGRPLPEMPLAFFGADLTAAFQGHGWGRFRFDFGRYAHGLLGVDVAESFLGSVVKPSGRRVEALLAGFLAGLFSQLAGVELDCIQTECRANGAGLSRFLLTVPGRVRAVAGWADAGRTHADTLSQLEKTHDAD